MTREQVEIIEHSIAGLPRLTWWECEGCPLQEKCNAEDAVIENPPPCEKAVFEAVEVLKGLCK